MICADAAAERSISGAACPSISNAGYQKHGLRAIENQRCSAALQPLSVDESGGDTDLISNANLDSPTDRFPPIRRPSLK